MTSSPKLSKEHNNKITKHRRRPLPNDTEKVRIMVVNCQSLRRRKDILQTSIAQIRTDVIIGTESWLDPFIKDGDIFPEEFKGNVYRKDRKSDHHGGVFVAIKNTFDNEEAEELKSTAETIWAKVTLPSGSKLYYILARCTTHIQQTLHPWKKSREISGWLQVLTNSLDRG